MGLSPLLFGGTLPNQCTWSIFSSHRLKRPGPGMPREALGMQLLYSSLFSFMTLPAKICSDTVFSPSFYYLFLQSDCCNIKKEGNFKKEGNSRAVIIRKQYKLFAKCIQFVYLFTFFSIRPNIAWWPKRNGCILLALTYLVCR